MSFCSIFYRKMCLCSEWGRLVDTRRSRRLINGDIFALSHSPDINLIWQLSQLHQLSIIMGCHCVSCSLSDEHQPAETKNQRVKQRRVLLIVHSSQWHFSCPCSLFLCLALMSDSLLVIHTHTVRFMSNPTLIIFWYVVNTFPVVFKLW